MPTKTRSTKGSTAKKDGAKKEPDTTKAAPAVSKREQARQEKEAAAAKARQALIDSGDLIVTKDFEYERVTKETKVTIRAQKAIDLLQKSKQPVLMQDLANQVGAYYDDLLPAIVALECLGLVQRFEAKDLRASATRRRRAVAFLWVGNNGSK